MVALAFRTTYLLKTKALSVQCASHWLNQSVHLKNLKYFGKKFI